MIYYCMDAESSTSASGCINATIHFDTPSHHATKTWKAYKWSNFSSLFKGMHNHSIPAWLPFFYFLLSSHSTLTGERKPAPNNPNTRENTYATTLKKKTVLIQEKTLHFHSAPLIYIVYKSATNMKLSDRLLANHITVSQLSVVVYIQIIFCNIMFFQLEAILWTKWLAKPRGF